MVSCWYLHLIKKTDNQEGLLDGDCVGLFVIFRVYLTGVVNWCVEEQCWNWCQAGEYFK